MGFWDAAHDISTLTLIFEIQNCDGKSGPGLYVYCKSFLSFFFAHVSKLKVWKWAVNSCKKITVLKRNFNIITMNNCSIFTFSLYGYLFLFTVKFWNHIQKAKIKSINSYFKYFFKYWKIKLNFSREARFH